jgi:sigma-B regulation protein RsbU (phosphoserine phosphatase)
MVETGPLLETMTRRISDSLHVPKIASLLRHSSGYIVAHALGYPSDPAVSFAEHGPTVQHLRSHPLPLRIYPEDPKSWLHAAGEDRPGLEALDAQLLIPLCAREELLGILSLGPKQSEEPYSASDVRVLGSVAAQAGFALENTRLAAAIAAEVAGRERMNRELEIAREVQEQLFPQGHPTVQGLDYGGRCRPARGVGGDYYDFLPLPGGSFGIAIGDVSGKGIPAALLMASLQASLRSQAIAGPTDLSALMANLNRLTCEASPANRYVTFFYAQYEPATRKLSYVNAGHNAPMVFRPAQNSRIRLEAGGPVIGLLPSATFEKASVVLQPGDTLVAFTDGISEAMNLQSEEWGEEQIAQTVEEASGLDAAQLVDSLIAAADRFAAGAEQYDDMTVVVVRAV